MANVLIVEDDLLMRGLHAGSLRDEGFRVFEASDDVEALADLSGQNMDLILLDIRIPNVDTPSLMAELRGRHPRSRTIVCSCHPPDVQREMIPSADAYFDKMEGCAALLTQVRSVLRSPHAA